MTEEILKYRKPRATKQRISTAESYLRSIQDIIENLNYGSEQEVTAALFEYTKNLKSMKAGREFLTDLIAWQKWKINKS
tara:strand:- start:362 stop:598 length:237 start_codon:yes stop_codon:yes gene_type:complete